MKEIVLFTVGEVLGFVCTVSTHNKGEQTHTLLIVSFFGRHSVAHVFWSSHEGSHLVNWSTQSSTESIYQRVDSAMKSTQW